MDQTNFDRLGSAIVELGNNLATTESDIAAMGMNLAAAGKQVGMTEPQILGFAGALSSVGLEAQAGGTAFSKLMLNMQASVQTGNKNLQKFAKVANMSVGNFKELFAKDASGAIATFLKGLGELDNKAVVLEEMGITETKLRDALLRASEANELFINSQNMATEAWEENTALTNEASQKYETMASKLQILKNRVVDVGISFGELLMPAIQGIIESLGGAVEWALNLDEGTKNLIIRVGLLVAAIGPVLLATAKVIKAVTSIIKVVKLLKVAFAVLPGPVGIAIAAVAALAVGLNRYKKAQEKAREATLNFSKDLKEARENFEKVNDSVYNTRELTREYRELEAKLDDMAGSAEETAIAKGRMKDIEKELMDMHPGVLSRYDEENEKLSEQFGLLDDINDLEIERARATYEREHREAAEALPDAMALYHTLGEKKAGIEATRTMSEGLAPQLYEIQIEWELADLSLSKGSDEWLRETDRIKETLRGLTSEVWDIPVEFDNAKDLQGFVKELNDIADRRTEMIVETEEEMAAALENIQEFYDSGIALVEEDLGGTLQDLAERLTDFNSQLQELEDNGLGDSDRAVELRGEMARLEPQVLEAAARIRDFGLTVEKVPEVKTIDVAQATKDIDGFKKQLDNIPPSKTVRLIVAKSGGNLPGFATGGIITKPTLATFAEEGPEAAIPLDGSANAKSLWLKAGEILGMMNTRPAMASIDGLIGGGGNITNNASKESYVIEYSPTVIVQGNASERDIERALVPSKKAVERIFYDILAREKRLSFSG